MRLVGFGECLPYFENYVEIDPSGQVDVFGIPILKIHMALGRQRARDDPGHGRVGRRDDGRGGGEEHRALRGARPRPRLRHPRARASRAWASDPKTSVLNQFQQAHDVRNLFVMDGAGFTSGACQNPTLTIMALAVRSTDYLMGEMKRGNL